VFRACRAGWAAGATMLVAASGGAGAARPPAVDPIGTWSCVLYGHPDFGDQRVLLHFAANGAARLSRFDGTKTGPWSALAGWFVDRDQLEFSDPQTGRHFTADLHRATLGGGWRTYAAVGGWWCSAIDNAPLPPASDLPRAPLHALLPVRTAIPLYPRQAVRDAKQGYVVSCFFVGADGNVRDPELIELSDEIFREPVLAALARSRYQGWQDDGTLRPGCRSYTFKLDQIVELDPQDPEG
jgi:Gram-negative bacterial TonB protein C-terminal